MEMVAPGNVDKHRRSMSGLKVTEQEKWGRDTARKRYGSLDYQFNAPPQPRDQSQPQDPVDRHGPNYSNDVPNSWLRGGGKGGEGKPGFDKGRK
jgi:hypothetical protein